jgi:VWFA-related protein
MLLAVACAAGGRAYGQPAAADPSAKLVRLSVVALDGKGSPVGDLTAGDFEISDAGKPQKVATFRHSDVKLSQAAPPGAGEFSNRGAGNVAHATVVLFDLLNNTFGARGEASSYLAEGLKSVESGENLYFYLLTADAKLYPVRALPGAEDAAPAAGGDQWTKDSKALIEGALNKMFQLRPTSTDIGVRVRLTCEALQSMGAMLAGIPGRKNIVWITHGVPLTLPGTSNTVGEPVDFTPIVRRLCLVLDRMNVAIYPVMHVPPGMGGSDESQSGGVSSEEALQQFADLTGGPSRATNAIGPVVRQAMIDVRTSYQIGYYPPAANWDGKFHKLRVSSTRKGVKLQAMTGYYALPDQPGGEKDALAVAAATAFDASEIGLRCTVAPSPSGGNVKRFTLGFDPADLRIVQQGDGYLSQLDMQMVTYLPGGDRKPSGIIPMKFTWTAEEMTKGKTEGLLWNPGIDVDVLENAEKVRFLVFDPDSHALGTVTIPMKKAK